MTVQHVQASLPVCKQPLLTMDSNNMEPPLTGLAPKLVPAQPLATMYETPVAQQEGILAPGTVAHHPLAASPSPSPAVPLPIKQEDVEAKVVPLAIKHEVVDASAVPLALKREESEAKAVPAAIKQEKIDVKTIPVAIKPEKIEAEDSPSFKHGILMNGAQANAPEANARRSGREQKSRLIYINGQVLCSLPIRAVPVSVQLCFANVIIPSVIF